MVGYPKHVIKRCPARTSIGLVIIMGSMPSKSEDTVSEEMRADASLSPGSFPRTTGLTITLAATGNLPERTVGYAVYGDSSAPSERTILFMHGTPGTRLFFTLRHNEHAMEHHVRVLVPERAGYGLSTPVPGRTLLDCAADAAAVLDAEDVQGAHVVGYSAGGPFALAFAKQFKERCIGVVIVSSLSPNVPGVTRGMTTLSKVGYFLAGRTPKLLQWLVGALVSDALKEVFDDHKADFTDEENAQFKGSPDIRRCFAAGTMELYSREGGAVAEAEDYVLFARDWGFRLEEIEGVSVFLYGGSEDNKCTVGMFRELERGLGMGRAQLKAKLIEGETHLLFYRLFEESLFEDIGL